MADPKTPEELLADAKIAADKLIADAKEAAAQTTTDAEDAAKQTAADAKEAADKVVSDAKEASKPPTMPAGKKTKHGVLRTVKAVRNHQCKIKHGPRGKKSSYTTYDLKKGEIYEIPQDHIDILNQQGNSQPDATVVII